MGGTGRSGLKGLGVAEERGKVKGCGRERREESDGGGWGGCECSTFLGVEVFERKGRADAGPGADAYLWPLFSPHTPSSPAHPLLPLSNSLISTSFPPLLFPFISAIPLILYAPPPAPPLNLSISFSSLPISSHASHSLPIPLSHPLHLIRPRSPQINHLLLLFPISSPLFPSSPSPHSSSPPPPPPPPHPLPPPPPHPTPPPPRHRLQLCSRPLL